MVSVLLVKPSIVSSRLDETFVGKSFGGSKMEESADGGCHLLTMPGNRDSFSHSGCGGVLSTPPKRRLDGSIGLAFLKHISSQSGNFNNQTSMTVGQPATWLNHNPSAPTTVCNVGFT